MTKSLQEKIEALDISLPYVWRLRLSKTDFNEIESHLKTIVVKEGVSSLVKSDNAIMTIAYMAEWYKRRYLSGNRCELTDGIDLETLWNNSGISKKRYLYQDENGSKRWLYSIYVLGGLAIKHELSRNDNMRFLKGLCRIYHGENYTLENLDEATRAIAFRESINRKHSLYEYMRQILNGDMPFNTDDLADSNSDTNRFVATIKAANDEILRVKFRFEWQVTFSTQYTCMTRKLNVWLKPEEVGGELHQYLRYDRIHLWGVGHPENLQKLFIYVRYRNDDIVVEPSTMDNPIITYLNTGQADTGFLAFGIEKCAQCRHVPTCKFDTIEIVAKDELGNEYIAQTEVAREYLQLWRSVSYGDIWTSTQNAQRETALLFSNRCTLKDTCMTNDVYRQRFSDQKYGKSETWNFLHIYDSVTFSDEKGKEISLYNRIGYDQITTRIYADTIHYVNGGKVRHCYIDAPDESNEYEIDEWPLIFGCDDVIVRHFATKDDILDARPEESNLADMVEFKQPNGHYQEWTSTDVPQYGLLQLRITVKGHTFPFTVMYLPRLDEVCPICRDFDSTCIRYLNIDKTEACIQDVIPKDWMVLAPTISVHYGKSDDFCEIDVYRPTLLKEVLFDGKIIDYKYGDEKVVLPYIFKDRVQINDFSVHGYQAYECKNLGSIYDLLDRTKTNAALAKWKTGDWVDGGLDILEPSCLRVVFGRSESDTDWNGQEVLAWDYIQDHVPEVVAFDTTIDFGIIFQNLANNHDLTCNFPRDYGDFVWDGDSETMTPLASFLVANKAHTYFFIMMPLATRKANEMYKEVYLPLMELRNDNLTDQDKRGLLRLAEEFGFDWILFNVRIDIEN